MDPLCLMDTRTSRITCILCYVITSDYNTRTIFLYILLHNVISYNIIEFCLFQFRYKDGKMLCLQSVAELELKISVA